MALSALAPEKFASSGLRAPPKFAPERSAPERSALSSQVEVCPAEVRSGKVRSGKVRLREVHLGEIHSGKVHSGKVRLGELRFRSDLITAYFHGSHVTSRPTGQLEGPAADATKMSEGDLNAHDPRLR